MVNCRCTTAPNSKHSDSFSCPEGGGGGGGGGNTAPYHSTKSTLHDFGHSLMAGFSETYLPDFVLHGTSQPLSQFKDALISDLSCVLKVIVKPYV